MHEIKNVVVGSSLGEASDDTVRAGLAIAAAAGARLHLVHAYPVPVMYGSATMGVATTDPQLLETEQLFCRRRLDDQLARLGVSVKQLASVQLEVGVPHRLLDEVAARKKADLVVVGAAETRGLLAPLLGSTTDRVLRKATHPVLVVRGRPPVPPQSVLAPVDLSELSAQLLEKGLALLAGLGSTEPRMTALFVLSEEEHDRGGQLSGEQIERFAAEELERFLQPFGGRWGSRLRVGEPRREIVEEITAASPDLVLLGTHGRSGFERWLLGSVASDVVAASPVSVLVVPPGAGRG